MENGRRLKIATWKRIHINIFFAEKNGSIDEHFTFLSHVPSNDIYIKIIIMKSSWKRMIENGVIDFSFVFFF